MKRTATAILQHNPPYPLPAARLVTSKLASSLNLCRADHAHARRCYPVWMDFSEVGRRLSVQLLMNSSGLLSLTQQSLQLPDA